MLSQALWQTQQVLHGKNSAALPSLLIAAASGLLIWCHATDEDGSDPTKTFLALIVVQMMPLVFLELKILSCPDPISMLSRFGTKVLLMHAAFLVLRVCTWPLLEVGVGICNVIGMLCACLAVTFGFGFQWWTVRAWQNNLDICGLLALATVGAIVTELLDFNSRVSMLERTIFTASSYMEILAFMPAVWMVHQESKKNDSIDGPVMDLEKLAAFFFSFLVGFYILEDVVSAFRHAEDDLLVAGGHVVHFLLVLDFACFLMAHIYNPEKLQGRFMRWLPDQLWV
eukprot:TRINITY_DN3788_c0_g2_i1.p1 TRINITY_DN3788_c0_g2~~TRINITY_DN3788_c0_g2_i1.p1  ORF type:complete len:284 (-),score=74.50 TRINITY_DN3788_c0_g2_i1:172-1023(-)